MYRLALISIVAVHMAVVFGNAIAFFILPFTQPPEVALPLCSFIFWISLQRNGMCPMTHYENVVRRRLGMEEIKGFIKHYILNPLKERWNEETDSR